MMEKSEVEKLIKQKGPLGQIGKLVIERAKVEGEEGAWIFGGHKRQPEIRLRSQATWISALPKVTNGEFQKAEVLFGNKTETEVTLRKAKHFGEEIVLLQFDPNFESDDVLCRHPSCKNKNSKAAKRGQGSKRDLYLCPNHREELKSRISEAFEKEKIAFSSSEFTSEPGRFERYTSLISVLEGAYRDARNSKVPTIRDTSEIVEEVILNVRNFLIITSTLLNPDDGNLAVALPPVLHIFHLMLQNAANTGSLLQTLVGVLKEVVDTTLFAFGVIYTWVSLANPGTQIGAGVGGCIGAVAASTLGPWGGVAGLAAGGLLGGLIGSGIYKLCKECSDQQNIAAAREAWLAAGQVHGNPIAALQQDYRNQMEYHQMMYIINGNMNGGLCIFPRRFIIN